MYKSIKSDKTVKTIKTTKTQLYICLEIDQLEKVQHNSLPYDPNSLLKLILSPQGHSLVTYH